MSARQLSNALALTGASLAAVGFVLDAYLLTVGGVTAVALAAIVDYIRN